MVFSGRERRLAYGAALALLVVSVVVSVASISTDVWATVAGVLQGLALLVTMLVSGAGRRSVIAVITVAVVTTVAAAGLAITGSEAAPTVGPVLWALVVLGTIAAILRHLMTMDGVDIQVVLGLLSIYVLLGLLFAYLFQLNGVMGQAFFTQGRAGLDSYVYFSFVTIATVGYGDLTPMAGSPRALAIAESIIGQLYMVTVVALAVSRFSGFRKREG